MNCSDPIQSLLTEIGLKTQPELVPRNETVYPVDAQQLETVVQALLGAGWWHLTAITALTAGESIELLYHFWLYGGLTLRVRLPAAQPQTASITPIIPGAAFYEREIQELFGVRFTGLTDTQPLFLAEDWQGEAPMNPQPGQPGDSPAEDQNTEKKP